MHEHKPQESSHVWLSLHMDVPEHLLNYPVANQIDDVSVYS